MVSPPQNDLDYKTLEIAKIISFLNTKRPLSDICLLRYKQNSFGCFRKNSELQFFKNKTKSV